METIRISNVHSNQKGTVTEIKAHGTNPVFGFVWINDECYTLKKSANGRTFKLEKTK